MKAIEKTLDTIVKNPKYILKLIIQGITIGVFAGLCVCLYRFLLAGSEDVLFNIVDYIKGDVFLIILWFIVLFILALIVSYLLKWEPMSSGGGMPQIDAEVKGYLNVNWWRVLISKFIGGTLTTFAGLSLGREGPSIQIGAMAGKGVSKLFKNSKTDERRSIITGSGVGLAATFSAPLAGVIFSLEEFNHSFDKTIVFVGLVAAIVADFISKLIFGSSTIFSFPCPNLPLSSYWLLIVLGIFLGFAGYIYNRGMVGALDFVNRAKNIPITVKLIAIFMITGIVALTVPNILAGGHVMMEMLESNMPSLTVLVFLLVAKFIFLMLCFSSGAPGGIFYPLLVLGAYIGAIFGSVVVPIFGLEDIMVYKFIVISMAGFFASTIRAPITGVVLVAEMTGSSETLIAALIVSVIAYSIPLILNNNPIYESLSKRFFKTNQFDIFGCKSKHILREYIVPYDSPLIGMKISEVPLSNNSIIVSITRGASHLIANNDIEIKYADQLFILMDCNQYPYEDKEIISLLNNKDR